mgnify:CR=1 FL=1
MKAGESSQDRIVIPSSLNDKKDKDDSTFHSIYGELRNIFEGFDESSKFSRNLYSHSVVKNSLMSLHGILDEETPTITSQMI